VRYVAVLLVASACLSACASGAGTGAPRPQHNLITAEEIAAANVNYAYEAVERLRPQWLVPRPPRVLSDRRPLIPVVFLDNVEYGDINELWTIPVSEIREIRLLDDQEAVRRFGTKYNSGIIQVIRR